MENKHTDIGVKRVQSLTTINSAGIGNFILCFSFSLIYFSAMRTRIQTTPVMTDPGTARVIFLNMNM